MSARQPGVHVTSENDGTEVFKQASSDLQDLNLSGNKKSIECVGTTINHSQKLQLTAAHVLPKHSAPAAHAAAQLLGYRFRVGVVDGRILEGDFSCLDTRGNLILSNARQLNNGSATSRDQEMGQVLLPPAQRATCNVLACPDEVERLTKLIQCVVDC